MPQQPIQKRPPAPPLTPRQVSTAPGYSRYQFRPTGAVASATPAAGALLPSSTYNPRASSSPSPGGLGLSSKYGLGGAGAKLGVAGSATKQAAAPQRAGAGGAAGSSLGFSPHGNGDALPPPGARGGVGGLSPEQRGAGDYLYT